MIHEELVSTYADAAPSYATVKFWVNECRRGRESVKDECRDGRPKSQRNVDSIRAVRDLVNGDRRLGIRVIADRLRLSHGTTHSILRDDLGMSKVAAVWVVRNLSPEQKAKRVENSNSNLMRYCDGPQDFESRVVTEDETWLGYYDPETKQQSMQWKTVNEPRPQKFKKQRSAGKVMLTVFWDARGVLLTHYTMKGQTLKGVHYAQLIRDLKEAIKKKRRGIWSCGVLLLHDNCKVHKCGDVGDALKECKIEELPHPAYSPDLAPSDYYLFPNLKNDKRGMQFGSDNELKVWTENWLENRPKDWYLANM